MVCPRPALNQFPLLMLVSYHGTSRRPGIYHVPKGRCRPVLRPRLDYARADRSRPIGPRLEAARPLPRKRRARCAALSREDVQW